MTRKGMIHLLLDEINKLGKTSTVSSVTVTKHSHYIFEKIIDLSPHPRAVYLEMNLVLLLFEALYLSVRGEYV